MAKYLNYNGLSHYDEKIKEYIGEQITGIEQKVDNVSETGNPDVSAQEMATAVEYSTNVLIYPPESAYVRVLTGLSDPNAAVFFTLAITCKTWECSVMGVISEGNDYAQTCTMFLNSGSNYKEGELILLTGKNRRGYGLNYEVENYSTVGYTVKRTVGTDSSVTLEIAIKPISKVFKNVKTLLVGKGKTITKIPLKNATLNKIVVASNEKAASSQLETIARLSEVYVAD